MVEDLLAWSIVGLEAAAVSSACLALFFLRDRLTLMPLLSLVASLQLLPVVARSPLPVGPGLQADRGWIVIYGALTVLFLVVHIREGTHRARQLVGSLVLAFALSASVAGVLAVHQELEDAARTFVAIRAGVIRATLIFFDAVVVMATYEVLGRCVPRSVPVRVLGSLGLALAFDAMLDAFARHLETGDWSTHVLGGLLAAALATAVHGLVGVLYLLRFEERAFLRVETDKPMLDVVSVMTARRRYVPMRPQLVRDEESGLYNRSFFRDMMPVELERAEQYARSTTLLMLRVRDGGPTPAQMGRALLGSLRMTDVPCRYTADRYAALLPGADARAAHASCERLLTALSEEPGLDLDGLSVGVAVFPHDGHTLEALLHHAERRRVRSLHAAAK